MSDNDILSIKSELQSVKGELQTITAIMHEKWSSHDKRSDERWEDLMEEFHEFRRKMEGRPCDVHSQLMSAFNERLKQSEQRVQDLEFYRNAIAVAVIGALVTAMFSLFKH